MANVGVTFDFAAESAKLRTEIDKVRKELSSINKTAKGITDGFSTMGKAIVAGFSVGAVTAFLSKVNSNIDALNDLAGRLGASASGLQSLQVAASLAGGSAESMTTALGKMSTTIGDAVTGNKQAADAFDRLGLSARDLAALKPDEAFRKISDATAAIPNSFERASVAQDIFGKGAKEIAGLLSEGGAAIDAVNEQLAKQGALLSDLDVAKIGVMNDQLQFQQTVITNLGAKFLSGFAPSVGVATSAVGDMLGRLGGASEAGAGFGLAMVTAIKSIEATVYGLVAAFELLRSAIAKTFETMVNGFKGVPGPLGNALRLVTEATKALTGTSDEAQSVGLSLNAISETALANSKQAAGYAAQALAQLGNVGDVFKAAQAEADRMGAAAAARNAAAQGVGAGSKYDPNAARAAGDKAYSRDGSFSLSKDLAKEQFDPTLDPAYLQQLNINTALLALQDDFAASRLGQIQALEDSTVGMVLNSAQLQQQIEASKNATMGDMMGSLVGLAMQQGGALGKAGKALAIAQTIWSTGTAVMKAMAEVPFPGNIAAAASVAAMGVAQLSNIRKTSIGSGGSVIGARGGAVTGSSALSDNVVGAARSTEGDQRSAVQVIVNGNLFSGQETVSWLTEEIGKAVTGRDLVFISPGSRQAMELRGT